MPRKRIPRALRRAVLGASPTCHWCGGQRGPWDCDHLIPHAQGGETTRENLVASCRSCNRRRQAKPSGRILEWVKYTERQIRQIMTASLAR